MQLYSYWRSSSSYRVRIALELKGIAYRLRPVHLVRDGGEQRQQAYTAMNPQGYVPLLVDGDLQLTQSLAIIDYLDSVQPDPLLVPPSQPQRGRVLAFAQTVASDIQPLQNLSVLQHLTTALGHPAEMRAQWSAYWIGKGLSVLEQMLSRQSGDYCFGDAPTLADVVLIPQMYNAERFGLSMDDYPRLARVTRHCRDLPAVQRAHPDAQPDAE